MISVDVDAVGLQFSVKVSRNLFSFDRFNPVLISVHVHSSITAQGLMQVSALMMAPFSKAANSVSTANEKGTYF